MNFISPARILIIKKNRRTIITSFLILIFFLISFVAQSYFSYHEILRLNDVDNETKALLAEQSLNSIFLKSDLVLLDVMAELEQKNFTHHLDSKVYQQILKKRLDLIPEMTALKVIDEKGRYVGDADGVLTNAYLADRAYFKNHQKNPKAGLIISEPVKSKSLNKWVIVFSRRLNYKNGNFAGLIIATMTLDYFDQLFSKLESVPGAFVSIISRSDNTLVYRHPMIEAFLGQKFEVPMEMKALLEKDMASASFESSSPLTGVRQVTSYRMIGEYDLMILIGDEKSVILSGWRKQLYSNIVFLMMIAIGGAILLYRYLESLNEAESQRAQAAHASKLSSLGQMGAGIAHEINNPLAIMQGRIQIMKRKVTQDSYTKETLLEHFEKTNEMIERMAKIIKGLRNIARDGSNDPLVDEPVAKIVNACMDLCQERIKQDGAGFLVGEIPNVSLLCRGAEIIQVLLNLINNACDAVVALPDKWVKVEFQIVDAQAGSKHRKEIVISVIDSGKGIPKNVVEKLMQPFFTTKDPDKGTGLGLSISNNIIKNHGGRLEYNSNFPNTRFDITLPIVS